MSPSRIRCYRFASLIIVMGVIGCATAPYRYGGNEVADDSSDSVSQVEFGYGKPNRSMDRLAWCVGLPSRILPLHGNVNNHKLSDESARKLEVYLQDNGLSDVYVRVNQYDPIGEWHRLRANPRIAAPWRYSIGTLSWVGYTVVPGRIFGGDFYNPFTNSLSINSDVPAVVLSEAAYAKDIRHRQYPGAYAAVNELPVLSIWRRVHAVNEVLGYARETGDKELERETYRVVYPQMGVHFAGGGHSIATVFTSMPLYGIPLVALGGALAGHAIGQANIARLRAESDSEQHEVEFVKNFIEE